MAVYPEPIFPAIGEPASGYPLVIKLIPYASYHFPYPPPSQIIRRIHQVVAYQMYEEDSDLDAHVIAFEQVLWANGEINDLEIVDLFGTTLEKGL